MKNLIIVGTGGFAREVYYHAQNSVGYGADFIIKGFLEGNVSFLPEKYTLMPDKVLNNVCDYELEKDDVFIIAIANSKIKSEIASILYRKGAEFINIIHKTAIVFPDAEMGEGVIMCPFTIATCNTKIGDHVMFNLYSSIGHDSSIGNYSSVMCYVDISGNVQVGNCTFWGNCSLAIPGTKIDENVTVGAGAVVIKDISKGKTVVGVPAKCINNKE